MKTVIHLRNRSDIRQVHSLLETVFGLVKQYEVEIRPTSKKRTGLQNNSLHLWLTMLAEELNEAGFTQKKLLNLLKDGFEISCTLDSLKEIVQEVSYAMFGTRKTSELTTVQTTDLYDTVNQRFAEITGVSVPWPCIESQSQRSVDELLEESE